MGPVLDRGPPWGAHGEPCPGSPAWGPLPGIGRGRVHSRCVRALGELKQPPTPGRFSGNLKSRQLPWCVHGRGSAYRQVVFFPL